jgi:multidrug efflux system outer membrane protein
MRKGEAALLRCRRSEYALRRRAYPLLALVLAGCAGAPATLPPTAPLPQRWQAPQHDPAAVAADWLSDFTSVDLAPLVNEALAHNHDLAAAAARLEAAQARARIAGAPLLPEVSLGLDMARAASAGQTPGNDYSAQLRMSWEADLWGRLSHAARAGQRDADAAAEDYRAARLALAASVARSWFLAIETGQQWRLAQQTADSFGRSLEVIEARYRQGLDSALAVRLARTDAAAAKANLAARRRDVDAARRDLEVLLGRYPRAALDAAQHLPAIRAEVPVGLPAQLLARRPDLAASERRLSAAGERLEAARKNRLPSLRLTAVGGGASETLRQLLDWDYLLWRLLAGITQPVFEGGRLVAEQSLAAAQREEAWAIYAQALLVALREVEGALAAESRYREQEQALGEATREARAAERLAEARYRQGLVDIITLLEARRRAFNAESSWLRTARERLDNRVALYLALGGGFAAAPTPQSIEQP